MERCILTIPPSVPTRFPLVSELSPLTFFTTIHSAYHFIPLHPAPLSSLSLSFKILTIRHKTELESHEEVMIKAIKELKQSLVKSVISYKWSMENGLLRYRGKVYVPKMDLRQKIIALCHDSKIAGHPGRWKTLELVSWNYWWPQIVIYHIYIKCYLCFIPTIPIPVSRLSPLFLIPILFL